MSFSRATGATFIPLLSRIVLGTAFLLSGWYYCFSTATYTPSEHERISAMQASAGPRDATIRRVAIQGETDSEADATPAADTKPAKSSDGTRAVYRIALDLDHWGIQKGAIPLAWGIAVFEVVAGGLVLVGLFTRLWGVLLAILIGATFVLTTVQRDGMFDMNPFTWRGDPTSFYELYFQAATFVLAICLFLVGSGALALDNIVFGRRQDQSGANPPTAKAA